MNTKVTGIEVFLDGSDSAAALLFGEHEAFELELDEGISELYSGTVKLYAENAVYSEGLLQQIGKRISVSVNLTEELKSQQSDFKSNYHFTRHIDAVIDKIELIGKAYVAATDTDSGDVYEYAIDFVSPCEILNHTYSKYSDNDVSDLLSKLKHIFSYPETALKDSADSPDATAVSLFCLNEDSLKENLPKALLMQSGRKPLMYVINRLLLSYGLNYNFVHSADHSRPNLYLSRGYGVNLGSSITSSYFSENIESNYNYDRALIITCDRSDDSTPVLDSIRMCVRANSPDTGVTPPSPEDSGLLYVKYSDHEKGIAEVNSALETEKNFTDRSRRERCIYKIRASQIIYTPGTVIEVKGYLGDEVKVIVSHAKLHVRAELSHRFALADSQEPSVAVLADAYEFNDRNPGSFVQMQPDKNAYGGESSFSQPLSALLNPVVSSAVTLFEAVVCDGSGRYTGVWDDVSNEPLAGSICLCVGDNTLKPSRFYALLSDKKIVQAKLTSTVAFSEVFNFPRIGQRILLLCYGSSYYLHSFMSTEDTRTPNTLSMKARNSAVAALKLLSFKKESSRVHVWSSDPAMNKGSPDYEKLRHGVDSSIKLDINNDAYDVIRKKIFSGTENDLVKQMNEQENTHIYDERYEGVSRMLPEYQHGLSESEHPMLFRDNSLKDRCSEVKKVFDSLSDEIEEKKNEVSNTENEINKLTKLISATRSQGQSARNDREIASLEEQLQSQKTINESLRELLKSLKERFILLADDVYAVTDEFFHQIGLPKTATAGLANILKVDHDGNIEINAPNGAVTINARNINLVSAKGTSITDNGTIRLSTTDSITLGSRGTALKVMPGTLSISSVPFTNGAMSGFGSNISVDCFDGVKISGSTVGISGLFSAAMSDSFGSAYSASKGTTLISGASINMMTQARYAYTANVGLFDITLGKELAKTVAGFAGDSKYTSTILDGIVYPFIKNTYQLAAIATPKYVKQIAAYNAEQCSFPTLLAYACDFVCSTIDEIATLLTCSTTIAKLAAPDNWMEETGLVGTTHTQDIKYILTSLKYVLNTLAAHALLVANYMEGKNKVVKLNLANGKYVLDAYKKTELLEETTEAKSIDAGKVDKTHKETDGDDKEKDEELDHKQENPQKEEI